MSEAVAEQQTAKHERKPVEVITWQVGMTLAQLERQVIKQALNAFEGNKTRAAQSLGVSVRTITNKQEEWAREDFELARRPDLRRERAESYDKRMQNHAENQNGYYKDGPGDKPAPVGLGRDYNPEAEERLRARTNEILADNKRKADEKSQRLSQAAAGISVESAAQVPAQQSVSLPIGQEVQDMPPKSHSKGGNGQRR